MTTPPDAPTPDFTGVLRFNPADGSVSGTLTDRLDDHVVFHGVKVGASYSLFQTGSPHSDLYTGELRRDTEGARLIHGVLTRRDGATILFRAEKAPSGGHALTGRRGEMPGWARLPLVDG